jgi:uncharacterized protein
MMAPKFIAYRKLLRLSRAIALCCLASVGEVSAQGQVAIIIDDLGYNLSLGKRTLALPGNITVAVLPFTPHGRQLAELAHSAGKEVMLHAPMSNKRHLALGPGGLTETMNHTEFLAILRRNLADIPHVKGVNNHMGSLLTEATEPMRWLMAELQARQLFFIDSRTSAQTQALHMAERIKLPSRKRDIFLDDQRSTSAILIQLKRALKLAQQQGSALAIGHPYPETLEVLQSLPHLLDSYQVSLVFASQLLNPRQQLALTPIKNTDCLAPPEYLWPINKTPPNPFDSNLLLKSTNVD